MIAFNPISLIFWLKKVRQLEIAARDLCVGEFLAESIQRSLFKVCQYFARVGVRFVTQHFNHSFIVFFSILFGSSRYAQGGTKP